MRVDQVRCGPAVEAILGHARFGKVLEVVNLATLASTLEGLDLNEFAILTRLGNYELIKDQGDL